MQTGSGTRWHGIPTPMDNLFYPSVMFGGGGAEGQVALLVIGAPSFVLRFDLVEAVCGYSETLYWSLSTDTARPQHTLNLIQGSPLLDQIKAFRQDTPLAHFLVCGGDMCCEVIASNAYALTAYDSQDLAEAALAREIVGVRPDNGPAQWRSPMEPWT